MNRGTMYLKDNNFMTTPEAGARPVEVKLPKHMRLMWDGSGKKHLRMGHGEALQVVTTFDRGRPVPEVIDRFGQRTRIQLAA